MRVKWFSLILSVLLLSGTGSADELYFIDDDEKLTEIFSGMTFDGYHHKKDYELHRYYAGDGIMYGRNPDRGDVHGTWWISEGQICFQWSHGKKLKCRFVSYSSGQVMIYKHRKKKKDYKLRITLINRRPGNPLNLSK